MRTILIPKSKLPEVEKSLLYCPASEDCPEVLCQRCDTENILAPHEDVRSTTKRCRMCEAPLNNAPVFVGFIWTDYYYLYPEAG